jgi:hypothetical protein
MADVATPGPAAGNASLSQDPAAATGKAKREKVTGGEGKHEPLPAVLKVGTAMLKTWEEEEEERRSFQGSFLWSQVDSELKSLPARETLAFATR